MKVVLLAGGFGTRLAEYTESIPKPMVPIGRRPILWHIMHHYAVYGHKDFYLALGYKAQVVKEYFLNYNAINNDLTVDLQNGSVISHQQDEIDWRVTLVDTGLQTMTGGRVKRMQPFIGNETFMLTYGDGVANVDLVALLRFHRQHQKLVTVTAVRPSARFGELELKDSQVTSFQEKPQVHEGWINGGFFVIEPEFFKFIKDDSTILEKNPLEKVAQMGELVAFQHKGFGIAWIQKEIETI